MTSHYRKGRRLEYRVRDHLKKQGYYVVRSAGSKGLVDLVAVGHGKVLLIQVKRGLTEERAEGLLQFLVAELNRNGVVFTPNISVAIYFTEPNEFGLKKVVWEVIA